MRFAMLVTLNALFATQALAEIDVEFREGAPKDRFTITNTGECEVRDVQLSIDLSTSAAGLIFDTTEQGAGVEVFQPFEFVAGRELVNAMPKVTDGQTIVDIDIKALARSQNIVFTIDVDDTTGNREITVNGSEIAGATIRAGGEIATFNERAVARMSWDSCRS